MKGTTKYPYEHKHTHAIQREHSVCLLSVRCINLVVLLHETTALNAIYSHCVFHNGTTNIQKYFRKTKIYRRVFIMARSAEIVNLESLRRIGTAKITETTKTAETTNKLGYRKIISTLSAVPIVPIKISPHLCDKFPNIFHILQKSSIFAP